MAKIKIEYFLVCLILIVSLALRLYHIDGYMNFLGDEGRDVRIVRDLLHGNLVFIGPQTSVGNMYLGPLYYYLIAPALFLSGLNPVGPAIMIAIIGTITVALVWYVGKSWFGSSTGLIAAMLYALSPVTVIYSRSSWNPNPMPLFALICVFSIYQVWQKQKYAYLLITATSFAFVLQMHYLGLLLAPVLITFWLLSFRKNCRFILYTLYSILIFLLLMSPLVLFDLRHDLLNFNAFKTFFLERQTTVNLNPANSNRFLPTLYQITQDLIMARQSLFLPLLSLLSIAASIWLFFVTKAKQHRPYILLMVWLSFAILGLSVYKQHVYAHYFGFIFPAVYLLIGLLISKLPRPLAVAFLGLLIFLDIYYSPLKEKPNYQLQRTEAITNTIIKQSDNQPFNFGLIAKQNYDESYRYFFENQKAPLIRGESGISNQLFVVCEDGDNCQPLGNPAYQVAIFGPAKIVNQWQIDGVKIYQLQHTQI